MEKTSWKVCNINGWVTACDPGRLTSTPYHKSYRREELSRGMNLTAYCEDLPDVKVREIGTDFLTVAFSGRQHKIPTGGHIDTPRKGLSYAYSEATIYVKAEE